MRDEKERPRPAVTGRGHSAGTAQEHSTSETKPLLRKWLLVMHAISDSRLNGAELRVLPAVLNRMNDSLECWPGYGRIASDTGMTRRTANRAIDRLVGLGYLEKQPRGNCVSNLYRIGNLSTRTTIDTQTDSDIQADSDVDTQTDTPIGPRVTPLSVCVSTELDSLNLTSESDQLNPNNNGHRFDEFWSVWPRKVKKADALKAWQRHKLDAIANRIIADVEASTEVAGKWRGGQFKFCPHPTTYLNGSRWEDEWSSGGADRLRGDDTGTAEKVNADSLKKAEERWKT